MLSAQPKALLDKVKAAIMVIEVDGRVRFFNKEVAKLLKFEKNIEALPELFVAWQKNSDRNLEYLWEEPTDRIDIDIDYPLPDGTIQHLHLVFSHYEDEYLLLTLYPIPKRTLRATEALSQNPIPTAVIPPQTQPGTQAPTALKQDILPPENEEGWATSAANFLRNQLEQDIKNPPLIWQVFPQEALIVDHTLKILARNRKSRKLKPEAEYCYQYIGHSQPCAKCPAREGFTSSWQQTIGHQQDGTYVTEVFTPYPGGQGATLLIEDTTDKVRMLHAIREQRLALEEKSQTLSHLLELTKKLHGNHNPQESAKIFLDSLEKLINPDSILLFIDGDVPGHLWLHQGRGLDNLVVEKLVKLYQDGRLVNTPFQFSENQLIWHREKVFQQPFLANADRQMGLLLVVTSGVLRNQVALTLYCEPFLTYLNEINLSRRLALLANFDDLTGLYNRSYMERKLAALTHDFKQQGKPFAIVLGDANGLKPVNDSYGYETGDRLLKIVSQCLKVQSRAEDIVCRLGGDEFCVMMPGANQATAEEFVRRVDAHNKDRTLTASEGTAPVSIHISLGAAATDLYPVDSLLKEAGLAVYQTKEDYYKNRPRYR